MLGFLAVSNWSKYSKQFAHDKEALYQYKRIILLSQFTLAGSIIGVLHSLEDLVDGLYFMPMMDLIMALGIFICYRLNENGKHKAAKILFLTFLNVFFFVYSSLADHHLGIYLYYFSWVGLAAVVFETNENFYRFFFIGLSVTLTIILFATNFDAFGSVTFDAIDIERSFIINFVSSIAVLVFFIIFMSNMNEQSEKRLFQMADEVKIQNISLEKANRELDRFFYSTSHDLKVPINDMTGILNQAIGESNHQPSLETFILLRERTQKLDNFLKDIIDYSRNKKEQIQRSSFNLDALIADVIENFKFVSGADKIIFSKELDATATITTDRVRLYIILNNVVANAVKYHRTRARDKWIKITASIEHEQLHIEIADNGQGIDPEVLPKIFNMFFRGTNQSKGSGLGLYIVRETVEKLEGSITVDSKVDKGTTFIISIPLDALQDTEALAAHILKTSVIKDS